MNYNLEKWANQKRDTLDFDDLAFDKVYVLEMADSSVQVVGRFRGLTIPCENLMAEFIGVYNGRSYSLSRSDLKRITLQK